MNSNILFPLETCHLCYSKYPRVELPFSPLQVETVYLEQSYFPFSLVLSVISVSRSINTSGITISNDFEQHGKCLEQSIYGLKHSILIRKHPSLISAGKQAIAKRERVYYISVSTLGRRKGVHCTLHTWFQHFSLPFSTLLSTRFWLASCFLGFTISVVVIMAYFSRVKYWLNMISYEESSGTSRSFFKVISLCLITATIWCSYLSYFYSVSSGQETQCQN